MSKPQKGKQPEIIFSLQKGETIEQAFERLLKEGKEAGKKEAKKKRSTKVVVNFLFFLSAIVLYLLLLNQNM